MRTAARRPPLHSARNTSMSSSDVSRSSSRIGRPEPSLVRSWADPHPGARGCQYLVRQCPRGACVYTSPIQIDRATWGDGLVDSRSATTPRTSTSDVKNTLFKRFTLHRKSGRMGLGLSILPNHCRSAWRQQSGADWLPMAVRCFFRFTLRSDRAYSYCHELNSLDHLVDDDEGCTPFCQFHAAACWL